MRLFSWIGWCALIGLGACSPQKIASYDTVNTPIDSTYHSQDLENLIEPFRTSVAKEMDLVIGHAHETLSGTKPESPLGNFTVDVIFNAIFAMKDKVPFSAMDRNNTIGLANFGGLRAPISKGTITVRHIFELMPFDNTICVVRLSPENQQEMVKYLKDRPQPIANTNLAFTGSTGQMMVKGKSWDNSSELYVITSGYLATGGDNMNFLKTAPDQWDSGVLIRDALIEHVKAEKEIGPYPVEGRLTYSE